MQKRNIISLFLLLFTVSTYAQLGINYKALIKDTNNAVIANSQITVNFIIYEGTGGANIVYQESQTPTTDANGIFIVNIGEGTPEAGNIFDAIAWGSDDHFLKTRIETEAGAGFTDLGTTGFKTVPYALLAKESTTAIQLTGGIDQSYIESLEDRIVVLEELMVVDVNIGDIKDGGVVFWIDPVDNAHGLICAFSDVGGTEEWGCDQVNLANVSDVSSSFSGPGADIGEGFDNTNNIINDCSETSAASITRTLGSNWFLPSINELSEMYQNKSILQAVSDFSAFSHKYWSSSEKDDDEAWDIDMLHGGVQGADKKHKKKSLRAVRAF